MWALYLYLYLFLMSRSLAWTSTVGLDIRINSPVLSTIFIDTWSKCDRGSRQVALNQCYCIIIVYCSSKTVTALLSLVCFHSWQLLTLDVFCIIIDCIYNVKYCKRLSLGLSNVLLETMPGCTWLSRFESMFSTRYDAASLIFSGPGKPQLVCAILFVYLSLPGCENQLFNHQFDFSQNTCIHSDYVLMRGVPVYVLLFRLYTLMLFCLMEHSLFLIAYVSTWIY